MTEREPKTARIRDGAGEPRQYHIGPDVDLDREEVFDSQGSRIDDAYVDRVVAEVLAVRASRGRPSLSGRGGSQSPQVTFRLTPELREKAERRARAEGKRVSDIAREALERYVG